SSHSIFRKIEGARIQKSKEKIATRKRYVVCMNDPVENYDFISLSIPMISYAPKLTLFPVSSLASGQELEARGPSAWTVFPSPGASFRASFRIPVLDSFLIISNFAAALLQFLCGRRGVLLDAANSIKVTSHDVFVSSLARPDGGESLDGWSIDLVPPCNPFRRPLLPPDRRKTELQKHLYSSALVRSVMENERQIILAPSRRWMKYIRLTEALFAQDTPRGRRDSARTKS
ncbi:hypothetical protein TRV_06513, partial [Trichophyton verrucosum HKI 0517]